MAKNSSSKTERARSLRQTETKSEKLLWSVLRGNQLCNLKFRSQHPIGPYFGDFACVPNSLVVEIDGGYHEQVGEADLTREAYLREQGWTVLRYADEEVERDTEAVARGIARHLGLPYEFKKRLGTGSGMENVNAPQKRQARPK